MNNLQIGSRQSSLKFSTTRSSEIATAKIQKEFPLQLETRSFYECGHVGPEIRTGGAKLAGLPVGECECSGRPSEECFNYKSKAHRVTLLTRARRRISFDDISHGKIGNFDGLSEPSRLLTPATAEMDLPLIQKRWKGRSRPYQKQI